MKNGASDLTDVRTGGCLGHETKLKLQVRIRELEAENERLTREFEKATAIAIRRQDGYEEAGRMLDRERAENAELCAKVLEVLPQYLSGHDTDLRNESSKCRCSTCVKTRELLAKL